MPQKQKSDEEALSRSESLVEFYDAHEYLASSASSSSEDEVKANCNVFFVSYFNICLYVCSYECLSMYVV